MSGGAPVISTPMCDLTHFANRASGDTLPNALCPVPPNPSKATEPSLPRAAAFSFLVGYTFSGGSRRRVD